MGKNGKIHSPRCGHFLSRRRNDNNWYQNATASQNFCCHIKILQRQPCSCVREWVCVKSSIKISSHALHCVWMLDGARRRRERATFAVSSRRAQKWDKKHLREMKLIWYASRRASSRTRVLYTRGALLLPALSLARAAPQYARRQPLYTTNPLCAARECGGVMMLAFWHCRRAREREAGRRAGCRK